MSWMTFVNLSSQPVLWKTALSQNEPWILKNFWWNRYKYWMKLVVGFWIYVIFSLVAHVFSSMDAILPTVVWLPFNQPIIGSVVWFWTINWNLYLPSPDVKTFVRSILSCLESGVRFWVAFWIAYMKLLGTNVLTVEEMLYFVWILINSLYLLIALLHVGVEI